ncbi:hypothetical protein HLRTI_002488 [Halorhabdus tiamatea SARL4B]|uniref:Uncharacterized protein n=1 Tax=Halorhabdus tiamatea SARL4B TaxID=1033806 RepID=F7PM85_9EURY|nr:DUF5783 family protein [Halorhabdus tiamatea]ERJ05510.1 hypothetical protein HLRTI_002488 [Halorhabdus tiamatea SARL4B]CCQ32899.1 conserved hypothetical protein [Halorhabdus tiamatea SARL4B]
MTDFDPDRFTDKYEHYFTELQQAYRQAFEAMSERHDSDLIHGIDQRILAESEPFYEEDGRFRIELPEDATDRLPDVDADRLETVLGEYTDELATQLQAVFDVEDNR